MNRVIFFFFTALILAINLSPTLVFIQHTPSDRYFPFMHNNSADYYFYLALMREGATNHTLTTIPFTTEAHRPSLVFTYFLSIGKLSSLFGLSMEVGYLVARTLGSLLFFTSAWILIKKIKAPYPTLCYLFFLFAEPFLRIVSENGTTNLSPYLYWWTGIDAIRRASYLPHHMIGGFLLVSLFILIIDFVQKKKPISIPKFFSVAIVLLILILLIHTPSLLIFAITIGSVLCTVVLQSILSIFRHAEFISASKRNSLEILKRVQDDIKRKLNVNGLFFLTCLLGLSLLLMLSFAYYMGLDPLWKHALEWEKTLQLPFFPEILGGFGILLPFAIIGIVKSIKKGSFNYLLVSCWFLLPLLLLPIASLFGISNTRLIQGAPFLPFSILATLGIEWVAQKVSTKLKVNRSWVMTGILVLFLIQSLITLTWAYKDIIREYWTFYTNIYLDKRLFPAFEFINAEYKPDTVVLSSFYTGNYVPAFSNTKSFIGHFGYTEDLKSKETQTDTFFQMKMTKEEAKQFLKDKQIDLVFDAEEEKRMHSSPLYPDILKEVYKNEVVTIFSLK